MISLTMSGDVKTRLQENLKTEGGEARVRVREYSTGTPCCRKTVLGFTIDESEEDDVCAEIEGMPFVMSEELIEKWGQRSYRAEIDEHGNPVIMPRD